MFQEELDTMQAKYGLSQGELLQAARLVAEDDNVRTVDALTAEERDEMLRVLRVTSRLRRAA